MCLEVFEYFTRRLGLSNPPALSTCSRKSGVLIGANKKGISQNGFDTASFGKLICPRSGGGESANVFGITALIDHVNSPSSRLVLERRAIHGNSFALP